MIGYAMVALAAFMWGTWRFVLLAAERLADGKLDARVEGAIVMLVITLFAFALLPFETRSTHEARTRRDWLGVAWLGIADALNVLFLFIAYANTTVAIAVTTHYFAPIFVSLATLVLVREISSTTRSLDILAAIVGVFGLVLLLRPWSAELGARDLVGAAAGAGSAVFYASNVLINQRLVKKFSAIELMAFHGVVATPVLFAITPIHSYAALNVSSLLVLVVGGIGPGALGGVLFIGALRRIRATHASTLTFLEPLVAVGIAVAFFGERLTPVAWLGASIVLACAASVAALAR